MQSIAVDIKIDHKLTIAVRNDGAGIPVEMHAKEKVYIPEMVFGQLLTGSNFDDKQVSTNATTGHLFSH